MSQCRAPSTPQFTSNCSTSPLSEHPKGIKSVSSKLPARSKQQKPPKRVQAGLAVDPHRVRDNAVGLDLFHILSVWTNTVVVNHHHEQIQEPIPNSTKQLVTPWKQCSFAKAALSGSLYTCSLLDATNGINNSISRSFSATTCLFDSNRLSKRLVIGRFR